MLHQTNMASNERNYTETGEKILSKESSKEKAKLQINVTSILLTQALHLQARFQSYQRCK